MTVSRLVITNLRNLGSVDMAPGAEVNVIVGPNGSGKTSLLEGIYLLGRARSFVTGKQVALIKRGQKNCTVFGKVRTTRSGPAVSVGVERSLDGKQQIKIAGDRVNSSAALAELLPLQVINPGSFRLLDGGPKSRRQFIDWGVFHVEHSFVHNWKRFSRCLKQRNNLLRQRGSVDRQLESWDREFVESSLLLTEQRRSYVERLVPLFQDFLGKICDLTDIRMEFYPGWDADTALEKILIDSRMRDRKDGYTHYGPQRAELRVKYLGLNAADTLSRGQQKLLVCAMKIAQGYQYLEARGRPCVYLIDDLAAELDGNYRAALCGLLAEMDCQVFVTGVEESVLNGCWGQKEIQVFHVEQGQIVE